MSHARAQQVPTADAVPVQRARRVPPSTSHRIRDTGAHASGQRARTRDPLLSGRAVVAGALLTTASLALLDRFWTGRLSQFYDLCFVLVCIVAALAVQRSGLFTVGVLPPLLMVAVLAVFAVAEPATLTTQHLAFISTLLTGLAHHAAALVAGHGSALAILVARGTVDTDALRAT